MPIYEYRCHNGHTLEVMQRMSDDPLSSCTTCAAPVQRVFHPVAVHFKGSGFYTTDYKEKPKGSDEGKSKSGPDDSSKGSADTAGGSSKSDGSDSKPKAGSSDSKPKAGSSDSKPKAGSSDSKPSKSSSS